VVNTVNEGTGKGVLPQGDRTLLCMEKTVCFLSLREWIRGFHDLLRDTLTTKCAAECIGFPYKLVPASELCA
jgi:hypothetical protein